MRTLLGSLALAAFAALVALAPTPSDRARRAAGATSLAEYLRHRESPVSLAIPGLPGSAPALVVGPFGERALALLFPRGAGAGGRLDASVGPLSATLAALATEATDPNPPLCLLAHDEALDADRLTVAFGAALAATWSGAEPGVDAPRVLSGSAVGLSPYGYLALLERASQRRVAGVFAILDLEDDLAETDILRRVHLRLGPGGDIDALATDLADAARRPAAQEAWLAADADARAAVAETLVTVARELDRRAWLLGGRAVLVLLAPRTPLGPAARGVRDAVVAELAARGLAVVELGPEPLARDTQGVVSDAGHTALAEAAVAAWRAAR